LTVWDFTDGFESGQIVVGSGHWTNIPSGTPTVVTSPVYSGSFAARFNATGTAVTVRKTWTAVGVVITHFRFRFGSFPSGNIWLARPSNPGGQRAALQVEADGAGGRRDPPGVRVDDGVLVVTVDGKAL